MVASFYGCRAEKIRFRVSPLDGSNCKKCTSSNAIVGQACSTRTRASLRKYMHRTKVKKPGQWLISRV